MNILVNESLAKGLRKRFIREHEQSLQQNLGKAKRDFHLPSQRLGCVYRNVARSIRQIYADNITHVYRDHIGRKSETTAFSFWDTYDGHLYARGIRVSRKNPRNPEYMNFCRISDHVCERIYERLNTTSINVVKQELVSVFEVMNGLDSINFEHYQLAASIMVPTTRGLFVLDRCEDEEWVVKTWLNEDMFDEVQRGYFKKCLDDGGFDVKLKLAKSNLMITRHLRLS